MKNRLFHSEITIAIITIILLTVITHGFRLASLGFYRDDWYLLWNGYTQGFQSIGPIFQGDRPFMGIIYAWVYRFLGNEALAWHLYALVLKLVGALAFFWLLRMIWPSSVFETTTATLLFVVYPGFLQQPNANTFQNHLLGYLLAILSIAFTIRAIQTSRIWKTVLLYGAAVIFQVVYLNIYEYMIGLEGVRILLLWYVTSRDIRGSFKVKIKIFLKHWIIFAPAIIGVLYWRIFVFESSRQAMNMGSLLSTYSSSKLSSLYYVVVDFSVDLLDAIIAAWIVPLYGFLRESTYRDIGMSVLYAMVAVGLLSLYYRYLRRRNLLIEGQEKYKKYAVFIWIGLVATFVTILPIVLAGRNIYFSNQFDRYTLQATIGISLLLIGIILYSLRGNLGIYLFVLLIGLGVATHFHNISFYQEFWNIQRELWWQLSWRAPDILDETVLVAMLPPDYKLAESYEIWGPANIIYRPDEENLKIPAEVLNRSTAQYILRGADDEREQRGALIIRNFKNVLVVSMPTPYNCVNAIDGNKFELSQSEDLLVTQVAPYSKIDRIDIDGNTHDPPFSIFGAEPDHTWCYFYQKMSLARQRNDWDEVARLADEALDLGFKPLDLYEWMPVLEGYANTGRNKDARHISRIIQSDKNLQHSICSQLFDLQDIPPNYNHDLIYGELCLKN
ncbi:MAG: hypothetical protein ACK2U1_02475 [Anaerolineales bacterium]